MKLAIDQLLDERESGTVECDRLFIEAEQETDPVPVVRTIRNNFSSESICVSEVITVVSAANFTSTDVPRWLVTNQIFFADRVVVNHCDLATADQIDRCSRQIRAVKWLPIINATRGIVDPDEIWRMSVGLSDAEIEALIQQRQEARQSRNFAQADRIRNQLQAVGVTLIDQPQAQIRWHP